MWRLCGWSRFPKVDRHDRILLYPKRPFDRGLLVNLASTACPHCSEFLAYWNLGPFVCRNGQQMALEGSQAGTCLSPITVSDVASFDDLFTFSLFLRPHGDVPSLRLLFVSLSRKLNLACASCCQQQLGFALLFVSHDLVPLPDGTT